MIIYEEIEALNAKFEDRGKLIIKMSHSIHTIQ